MLISLAQNGCLTHTPFVGRGHDPADQVAHFALARFNESAFVSLRFDGVMTPPYEAINNIFMRYKPVTYRFSFFPARLAAKLMARVSTMRISAMAKATSILPCSLA